MQQVLFNVLTESSCGKNTKGPLFFWSCLLARTRTDNNSYSHVNVPIIIDIGTNMFVPIDSGYAHENVPIRIVIRTNVYVSICGRRQWLFVPACLPISIGIRTNVRVCGSRQSQAAEARRKGAMAPTKMLGAKVTLWSMKNSDYQKKGDLGKSIIRLEKYARNVVNLGKFRKNYERFGIFTQQIEKIRKISEKNSENL